MLQMNLAVIWVPAALPAVTSINYNLTSRHNSVHPFRNLKAHAHTLWECGVLLVFRGCSQLHEVEYDESFCHIGKVCR